MTAVKVNKKHMVILGLLLCLCCLCGGSQRNHSNSRYAYTVIKTISYNNKNIPGTAYSHRDHRYYRFLVLQRYCSFYRCVFKFVPHHRGYDQPIIFNGAFTNIGKYGLDFPSLKLKKGIDHQVVYADKEIIVATQHRYIDSKKIDLVHTCVDGKWYWIKKDGFVATTDKAVFGTGLQNKYQTIDYEIDPTIKGREREDIIQAGERWNRALQHKVFILCSNKTPLDQIDMYVNNFNGKLNCCAYECANNGYNLGTVIIAKKTVSDFINKGHNWRFTDTVEHEFGHALGLNHTYYGNVKSTLLHDPTFNWTDDSKAYQVVKSNDPMSTYDNYRGKCHIYTNEIDAIKLGRKLQLYSNNRRNRTLQKLQQSLNNIYFTYVMHDFN